MLLEITHSMPHHRAHVLAKFTAGAKMRLVLVPTGEKSWMVLTVCAHSSGCVHCNDILRRIDYANLSTIHRNMEPDDRLSPLEVDQVPDDRRVAAEGGPQ